MDVNGFIKVFCELTNEDELNKGISCFAKMMGFDQYRFAFLVPQHSVWPKLMVFSQCDKSWILRYRTENMISRDPIIYLAMQQQSPIYWRELILKNSMPCASLDILLEARNYGLNDGVSFSCHGLAGEQGVLSFITSEKDFDIKSVSPELSYMSGYIFDAAVRITKDSFLYPKLSVREVECLFWAGEGKTAEEIGMILSISARTVNFHIGMAVKKTNSMNRCQAIAKAVSRGVLRPNFTLISIEEYH